MRRRVSIARALVTRPLVVLYDSPTAGLDPVTSQTIITLILRLRDTQGVTSVLATHRLQDAFGLASYRFDGQSGRVVPVAHNGASRPSGAATTFVVLREGKVYFEGTPPELAETRRRVFTALFVVTWMALYGNSMRRSTDGATQTIDVDRTPSWIVCSGGSRFAGRGHFLCDRRQRIWGPKYRLRAFLPEVDGLTVGAPVRVDGVDVGNVEKIAIAVPEAGRVDIERPEHRS